MKSLIAALALSVALAGPVSAALLPPYSTASTPAGNTVTNTTTATLLTDKKELEGVETWDLRSGMTLEIECMGVLTTDASAPGTLTVAIIQGSGNSGNTLTTLGTVTFTPPTSLSAAPITLRGHVTFNTFSSSAIETAFADLYVQGASNATLMYGMRPSGTSGTTGWGSGANLQQQINPIEIQITWGAALATDSITMQSCVYKRVV